MRVKDPENVRFYTEVDEIEEMIQNLTRFEEERSKGMIAFRKMK